MNRRARNAEPLDAVDLEVTRFQLEALERHLESLSAEVRAIRRTIEAVQGRNPARKPEGFDDHAA